MTARAANARRQGGFTLIEVMAALVIFLSGVVGVIALFASGLALHRDATRKAHVALVADEVRGIVEARLAPLTIEDGADLPVLTDVPVEGRPGYFYSVEMAVDPELGARGGILAAVFVYARDLGRARGADFSVFVRPGERAGGAIRDILAGRNRPPATAESEDQVESENREKK
jgi:prepilin-type N-terminal cleavage/methylation domain-containing protein